jgi:heme exporter protein A
VLENGYFDLKNDREADLLGCIERFGLSAYQHIPCGLLSAGQCRRVGLLRLLLSDAPLWILDEPLWALDHASIDLLMQSMQDHLDKGGMILLTSHQALPQLLSGHQDYQLC